MPHRTRRCTSAVPPLTLTPCLLAGGAQNAGLYWAIAISISPGFRILNPKAKWLGSIPVLGSGNAFELSHTQATACEIPRGEWRTVQEDFGVGGWDSREFDKASNRCPASSGPRSQVGLGDWPSSTARPPPPLWR